MGKPREARESTSGQEVSSGRGKARRELTPEQEAKKRSAWAGWVMIAIVLVVVVVLEYFLNRWFH